ncbi:MAG TPA: hypothetical protein VFC92_07495 [Bacteroidales bacterium]|nr:hypothetical protein [Bacteroidales bacterium]
MFDLANVKDYVGNKKVRYPAKVAGEENLQKELWDQSLEIARSFLPPPGNYPLIKSLLDAEQAFGYAFRRFCVS